MTMKQHKKLLSRLFAVSLLVCFTVFLYFFNHLDKPQMVNTEGRSFCRAKVVQVLQDNLQENGARIGDQRVLLQMRGGPLRGQTVEAVSANGYLFGAACTPGKNVVAITSVSGSQQVVSVYSVDREWAVYAFAAVFLLALCAIGGKNGVKSAGGLLFTMVCVFYLFFPMVFRGASPFWSAVLVSVLTTLVTMILVGGFTVKTVSAVLGTVFGVLVSGISAALFGFFSGISGYNVSNIESLLFVGQSTEIQVGGLLFAGILIASLGAVMDVAMSISSAVCELHEKNPLLNSRELFKSGISIGRDMMGTMSNTLILAFTGGSLGALITNYAYDLPYLQWINSGTIGIEIMQGLSGSLGIIFTVPLVALAAAVLVRLRVGKAE